MAASTEAAEGLRQRNAPLKAATEDEARETVLELNEAEEQSSKDEENKKTFGRTPDGTGKNPVKFTFRFKWDRGGRLGAFPFVARADRGSLHRTYDKGHGISVILSL